MRSNALSDTRFFWVDIGALLVASAAIAAVMFLIRSMDPEPSYLRTSVLAATMVGTLLLGRMCAGTGSRSMDPIRTLFVVFGSYFIWCMGISLFNFLFVPDPHFHADSWRSFIDRKGLVLSAGLSGAILCGLFTLAVVYLIRWVAGPIFASRRLP